MPYTVSSDTVGLAIGPVSETANDAHNAARGVPPVLLDMTPEQVSDEK